MHTNSLKAYREERPKLTGRKQEIMNFLTDNDTQVFTDRGIMNKMGFAEPNSVRPRITELIQEGWLVEYDSVKCPVTGKTVRLVGLN